MAIPRNHQLGLFDDLRMEKFVPMTDPKPTGHIEAITDQAHVIVKQLNELDTRLVVILDRVLGEPQPDQVGNDDAEPPSGALPFLESLLAHAIDQLYKVKCAVGRLEARL